jgi:hypothetical protein
MCNVQGWSGANVFVNLTVNQVSRKQQASVNSSVAFAAAHHLECTGTILQYWKLEVLAPATVHQR